MAIDDNTLYGLTGAQVKELPEKINAVKGLAKVLTAADYNYPTNNPTMVALWLLDAGAYTWENDVKVAVSTDTTDMAYYGYNGAIVSSTNSSFDRKAILAFGPVGKAYLYGTNASSGVYSGGAEFVTSLKIINNLTTTFSGRVLDASQGKVLKDLVDSLAVRGAGAPTTSTVGQVGTLYEDTTNGDLYICTDATDPYVWEAVGGGSGGGIHTLTADDYNYPAASPSVIATWLLDPGVYYIEDNLHAKVYVNGSLNVSDDVDTILVTKDSSGYAGIYIFGIGSSLKRYTTAISTGTGTVTNFTPPTLTQTTGTSTTNVMSQNATTGMIYADPSALRRIQIGSGASAAANDEIVIGKNATSNAVHAIAIGDSTGCYGDYNMTLGYGARSKLGETYAAAIGGWSKVNGSHSVALGSYSNATQKGQVDISTTLTTNTYGYNDSQYRLLTGLYDPQSDHDAATKGYVDTAASGIQALANYSTTEADTGATWIDGSAIYKKTIDVGALPNNTSKDVSHGITGLATVVSIAGTAKNASGDQIPLPFTFPTGGNVWLYVTSGGNIQLISDDDRSGYSGQITLYYTKSS